MAGRAGRIGGPRFFRPRRSERLRCPKRPAQSWLPMCGSTSPLRLHGMLGGDAPKTEDALLLAMLERSGPSALDQVLGDFAFASWNKNAQRLVCARDAFGIRPLAYVHKPGKLFAFASFPKALHGSGIVPKKVDEDALARRMVRNSRHDDSLVVGHQAPAALRMSWKYRAKGISLTRYWQLDRTAMGTRKCLPEEAARELRRLVDEAVKCRLPRSGRDRRASERRARFLGHRCPGGAAASRTGTRAARLFIPR